MLWIQLLRTELRIENYKQIYFSACVYRSIAQALKRQGLHAPSCNSQDNTHVDV